MASSDRWQSDIDYLQSTTSFLDRDGSYYSKLNELEYYKSRSLQRENREKEKAKEDENRQIAAADAIFEIKKRRRYDANQSALLLSKKKNISVDVDTMIYEKNLLLVSKSIMLDKILLELSDMLGDNVVLSKIEDLQEKIKSYSVIDIDRKYRNILLSKEKTSHVKI